MVDEINIEIGTFLTKDEGLPTMGLMIQTPFPVDIKQKINRVLKLEQLINKELKNIPECSSKECMGCAYDYLRAKLEFILKESKK